ncbi:hypothetical protein [Swingsia samuiensis]|uniref:Uncharacterized protein n=1 Tax=Swingsia samuiensis TaxID=1293412 RepID=A0A4Y6UH54_9PROT|nr:hypothetical protein [Swingsia samuiensis]QDH16344.1 hypothetical protein E3D00_01235 [Swingsia samuiensis]
MQNRSSDINSPLKLTKTQIDKLNVDTLGGTTNAYRGYQDMISFLQDAISTGTNTLDAASTFWYQQAITINGNDPTSFGNIFIHTATSYGLAWDGKSVDFQTLSNKIGLSVVSGTLKTGSLQQINSMLEDDIGTSLKYGGMTPGGWGGSFYYWNTPFQGKQTVGDAIMADTAQYDKFIATTANAVAVTGNMAIQQLGLSFHAGSISDEVNEFLNILNVGVPTIVSSSVEEGVKAEVLARAFEEDVLGQSAAGDPNFINGHVYLGKNWLTGEGTWMATSRVDSSPEKVTSNQELDALRATRIQEQDTKSGNASTNIFDTAIKTASAAATGKISLPSELQKAPGAVLTSKTQIPDVMLNLPALPQNLVNDTLKNIVSDLSHGAGDFLSPFVNVVGSGFTDVLNLAGGILNTATQASHIPSTGTMSSTHNVTITPAQHNTLFPSLFS